MARPRRRRPRGKAAKAAVVEAEPAGEAEAAGDEPDATAEPADAGTASTDEPEATVEPEADEPSAAESTADEPPGDDA